MRHDSEDDMSNVAKERSWFQRNKQKVVLTVVAVVLVIFAGVAIYLGATTQVRLI